MTQMTVRNPDFARAVRGSFARQGPMSHLGAALTAVGPGAVEIEVACRPELTRQHGFFHAAVTTAMMRVDQRG
ncbi:MAG: hypothetical protein ACYCVZ_11295 [Streptosporangiaceae bacterium]